MPTELLAPAALGLLPVLVFLLMLLALDSYKLVRLRLVVAVLAAGAARRRARHAAQRLGRRSPRPDIHAAHALRRAARRGDAQGRGRRRAAAHASRRIPDRRGDLRLRRRHRLRGGREPLVPELLPSAGLGVWFAARLRHGDHARRRERALRDRDARDARAARPHPLAHAAAGPADRDRAALGLQPLLPVAVPVDGRHPAGAAAAAVLRLPAQRARRRRLGRPRLRLRHRACSS